MFACNIVMIPPNFRLVYTISLGRPQLSLSLSSEPPWITSFFSVFHFLSKKQKDTEMAKAKKKK